MKQVWKRGVAMALAGCMMALSVPVMGVVAEEEEILLPPPDPEPWDPGFIVSGNYEYDVNEDGTLTFTGFVVKVTDAVIPETIDGKTVTAVERIVGYNTPLEESSSYYQSVISITVPESVTTIGYLGIYENLKKVTVLNNDCVFSGGYSSHIVANDVTLVELGTNNGISYGAQRFDYYGSICGYTNSTAQAYAEKMGYPFIALDAPEPTTTEQTTTTTTTEETTTTETTTTTTEETTTTTETTIETTTETTTTETVPRPEIIRKGDVTITYTDGGIASMGTDNDGVSIRKNIYNQWGNNVADVESNNPVNEKITIEFSIDGLGDRSSNLDEDGTPTDAYYAYIAGSVGSNGSWDRESDTAPCAHVPITGDGTYTVAWELKEGSDTIDCLVLQTNINLYNFEGATAENFGGVTITIHSITTFSGWSFGDINKDSKINSSDASYVLSAAAAVGLEQPSGLEDAAFARADVNNDDTVNAADASIILVYSAAQGLTTDVLNLDDFIPVNG